MVFWIALGVFVITNIIYVIFGSGEEQWWNTPDFPSMTTIRSLSESSFNRNESSEKHEL